MESIRNICGNDPTAPPQLLIGICAPSISDLPIWSAGPKGGLTDPDTYEFVRNAGFAAIQTHLIDVARPARDAGLVVTGLGRVDRPEDADHIAKKSKDAGHNAVTLHVGDGFESDDYALSLIDAIIDASLAEDHPVYIETHRATLTQDMQRTIGFVEAAPGIRFNGDFSNWYTGQEMTYGDFDSKFARLAPVLARTRFIHGRISSPGVMQIPIKRNADDACTTAFRRFWTEAMKGFLASARPGELLGFYPELLPPRHGFSQLIPGPDGEMREASDRWLDGLALVEIAKSCWRDATAAMDSNSSETIQYKE